MNILPREQQTHIIAALVDGLSIRATERLTGVHRDTIMRLGVRIGEACARLHDQRVRDVQPTRIEADEIWTFVGKKQRRRQPTDPAEYGDQYVFVGMDATRKLLIAYRIGKRDRATADAFVADLRARVLGQPQISTDGFSAYVDAIDTHFGPEVPYAQVVKDFYSDAPTEQARHRYSPGRIRAITKTVVSGEPAWDAISTSYIERANLSIRTHLKRFARLSLGFSKRLQNLEAAFALFVAYYNYCRVHETLRVTPAMEAGLTDHVWSVAELVAAALDTPETPVPPAPPPPTGMSAGQAKGTRGGERPGERPIRPHLRVIKGGVASSGRGGD